MSAPIVTRRQVRKSRADAPYSRLRFFRVVILLAFVALVARLFVLQVLSHDFYVTLAFNQHNIFAELYPERGTIYLQDPHSATNLFPAAINKNLNLVYAVPQDIDDPVGVAEQVAKILELDVAEVERKLSLADDPYEPLKRRVPDEICDQLRALDLPGIGYIAEPYRFYPEANYLSHVIGFVGVNETGGQIGQYGIEGYWNQDLAGEPGSLEAERDPLGRWIGAANRSLIPAKDGAAVVLTIDRAIQYVACEKLKQAVISHRATGGAVVIMNPSTGAILAMCGLPDFDPNNFSRVDDIAAFNNPAIFTAYEPGSIFKPITMAAAIDAGKVEPNTLYEDTGEVVIGPYVIRNSDGLAHGWQSMTQVLEKSLNTGTIFTVTELGPDLFRKYVQEFNFGQRTGIELDTESTGNTSSLEKNGDIWSATASYGQGITVTPLQMVTAFSAIANGGKLMKPYVVERVVDPTGHETINEPEVIRQVISKRAATLLGGMLVRVVESGHGKRAGVPGYWTAGKTGTAQIAKQYQTGYEEDAFIGSFIGFAPVDDPAFVMLVKIDRPQDVLWAESSAAPLFGEISDFLLNYMEIPPNRAK
ncbi:penicillin-binding protein 2 [Patescibacteria group bacterium]|nr:penicillin-binding protein 2 [Patescibacteria group bacterium]MBU1028678.1 penicillin-binding protein 2 [Patescibacteria group bacterium]